MKKSIIAILIVSLVMSIGTMGIAYADDLSDKQNELEQTNKEKDEVKQGLNSLEDQIKAQQKEVDKLQAELSEKQKQVDTIKGEIDQLKADIEERRTGFNGRLRAMYKNGSIGYLDVLLSSGSVQEFLSNMEMIQRIYKSDRDILMELKSEHEEMEKKQTALLEEEAQVAEKKAAADAEKASLDGKKKELQAQLDQLNEDAKRITDEIAALQKPDVDYGGDGTFMWPTISRWITSPFGYRYHPVTGYWRGHTGIDIGATMNSPVYASASGVVILSREYGGYGNAVVIDHGDGMSTLYGHNNTLLVSPGEVVTQGQVIAYSGSTGVSTGPHLHFEIRVNGQPVDPMNYL